MSDSKVFMFPESGTSNGNLVSMLAPLLQQRGVDPNVLLAMNRNNDGFGGEGGWFMWVIFLFFLMGWGGNGWNGFGNRGTEGLANQINNDYGRDLLLQAINGNGTAISQLATTLNCDVNAIQTAINSVSASVANVGTQVGMSGQQVINAIQSGNQQIAAQMAQCCCDNKLLVTNQGYENRIANLEQTNQLGSKMDSNASSISSKVDGVTTAIANQTALINDKFCALEMRDMQAKINQLQEEKSTLQNHISNANQTSQIQGYIASVVNPIAQEVNAIKAAQPATVTLPYSCATAVPTALAYQYGISNVNQGLWF